MIKTVINLRLKFISQYEEERMNKWVFPRWVILSGFLLTSVSCATSQKIQVEQIGDNELSCGELQQELKRLDQSQADIDSKKGLTGTNVAAALFWLPGLAYTYYDAGQATELIMARKSHISSLYDKKKCTKR